MAEEAPDEAKPENKLINPNPLISQFPQQTITVESSKDGEPLIIQRGESLLCFEKCYKMPDPQLNDPFPVNRAPYINKTRFADYKQMDGLSQDFIDPSILTGSYG